MPQLLVFQEDGAFPVSTETDENIKAQIFRKISPNFFAAIKISGLFAKMHVRVAPKQEKPYPPFVESRHAINLNLQRRIFREQL